ncbi:MAG: DUF1508 domain-containing protein [Sphaerochaetaceae bacterium]|jgi:uncharacterized protein YegP (UPF0339 family)|nr:DUF1508 domain-containing protein [Sphaerochaetaceae bacterium]NLO60399.1 DUF1508 domain-containing protein [Spirochaetales bacterium]MDD4259727.1 DUF1508 domain-containing protein [Sphaerochaetaceae bacterium]MDD4763608.1 DUF1508 domain-containing protein [Sphaerochaetaceae bacterium]MDD4842555.1 DUF1508 domain-containing protein [Sphaerochaetaceae bacterium]
MPGKFIVTKTPKGFFRFSLQAANAVTILTSQNYSSLKACRDGIASVKKNASVQVEDQTLQKVEKKGFPKYEVYLDTAGQYRFRLLASNGQNIAICEEGYASKSGCLNGIDSVGRTAGDAETDESALGQ